MDKKEYKELFGGKNSEQQNAVYNAILECGYDHEGNRDDENLAVYNWLESCGKTSITVELVNKLIELGFKIVKE